MSPAPAKRPAARQRKPVVVERIGVDDWASGKGHIKQFLLGAPDVGKTRYSSAYPRPVYLACEPTVPASIASRRIAYADPNDPHGTVYEAPHIIRIHQADRPSDAILDALDWLADIPKKKAPGAPPKYVTVVLDTLDGLSRILKNEWAVSENVSVFTGRDAWSFLEAKMSLIVTRLLNLDMNVLVLAHLKDKEVEEKLPDGSTARHTEYEPFLQGAAKEFIFNEFDLIGLVRKEFVGEEEVYGISYDSTPTFPFLKDHYALTAPGDKRLGRKFWPITLHDGTKGSGSPEEFEQTNYVDLFAELVAGLEGLGEGGTVEEIPEAGAPSDEGVMPAAAQGGPVAGAGAVSPKQPAKAPAKAAAPAKAPVKAVAAAPGAGAAPAAPATAVPEAPAQPAAVEEPVAEEPVAPETAVPETTVSEAEPAAAVAEQVTEPAGEAAPVTEEEAVAHVKETLGGEEITADATADAGDAEHAHSEDGGCPICGKSMEKEQADLVQLSRLKHRTLVLPDGRKFYDTGGCCYDCYQRLNDDKAAGTGLYAPAA